MLAVDAVRREHDEVDLQVRCLLEDGLGPPAEDDLVAGPHSGLGETVGDHRQLGRRPRLELAVEVGHLVEVHVLDDLDHVQQRDLGAVAARGLQGDQDRRLVLVGEVQRHQQTAEHGSPRSSLSRPRPQRPR